MTALVIVCEKIPSDKDSREIRQRIAEAMIAYARSGKRTLSDFENTGSEILREVTAACGRLARRPDP